MGTCQDYLYVLDYCMELFPLSFFLSFGNPPPLFLGARLSKVISIWSLNDTVSCTTGGGRNALFRFVEVVGRRSMLHADVCVIAVTW